MKNFVYVATGVVVLGLVGCRNGSEQGNKYGHDFVHAIKNENKVAQLEVPEVTQKYVSVDHTGRPEFFTLGRSNKIEKFPCTQCHINGQKPKKNNNLQLAHGNVDLFHGSKKVMSCTTCHQSSNMDTLKTLQGNAVAFDHSYKVCAQCHFKQEKDWAGGAHGKRVNYWAGPRVVNNCATCHNPHAPKFPKRWPKTYSQPEGGSR